MIQFKLPYGRTARMYFKVNYFCESKVKKYLYGWLTCYNCNDRLSDHVSYDHCSDWNGVCVAFNPRDDYSGTCGCTEFKIFFWDRLRHCLTQTQESST